MSGARGPIVTDLVGRTPVFAMVRIGTRTLLDAPDRRHQTLEVNRRGRGGSREPDGIERACRGAGERTAERARHGQVLGTGGGARPAKTSSTSCRRLCEVEIAAVERARRRGSSTTSSPRASTRSSNPDRDGDVLSTRSRHAGTVRHHLTPARTSGPRRLPFVDGTVGALRFYASAPVYTPDGGMVGRVCVIDTREDKRADAGPGAGACSRWATA